MQKFLVSLAFVARYVLYNRVQWHKTKQKLKGETVMEEVEDLAEFIQRYPHNTDCGDKFLDLVTLAYRKDREGLSLEEFVNKCIYCYGGTVAGSLISYLKNHL